MKLLKLVARSLRGISRYVAVRDGITLQTKESQPKPATCRQDLKTIFTFLPLEKCGLWA